MAISDLHILLNDIRSEMRELLALVDRLDNMTKYANERSYQLACELAETQARAERAEAEVKRRGDSIAELITALLDTLYQAQYRKENIVCHDFISAYEYATALLVRLGYATTDDNVYYALKWPGNEDEASNE